MYTVRFFHGLDKKLARFPRKDQERIAQAVRSLAEHPRPEESVHLRDVLYRLRVGNYRVIYAVFDKALIVVVVETVRRNENTYADLQTLLQRARNALGQSNLNR